MTTAAQLIAYLQTIPPDTEIEVLQENTSGYETTIRYVPLVLGEGSYFVDLRSNEFVKPDAPRYNKTFLELGET